MFALKQRLVGNSFGRSLVHWRNLWNLWRAVSLNPESGGVLCQDLCAHRLLPRLCSSSGVFVDVGSHIGSVIAAVRHQNPAIRIIAVEADPKKAAQLSRKFPDVQVHSCALGETNDEVKFYVDEKRPGYSSLAKRQPSEKDTQELTVHMRRLDDIISTIPGIEVVKIDVEGAELGVLRGSHQLVSRCRPVIMFESGLLSEESLGYTADELFDWFATQGYEIFVPNRVAHDGPPLQRESFIESHYYPRRTLNYFAVPSENRIKIRDQARQAFGILANGRP